ncbi:MAG: hypothetical protein HYW49_09680 [Deltaproteobacteria bacterium]|nr:hypothetical protein [Deltaproteobacteria bacterium]
MAYVFAASFLVLALETALLRILSITSWQFSAHLVVSVAMLGGGLAGVVLSLRPGIARWTSFHFAALVITACGSAWLAMAQPIEPFRFVVFPGESWRIGLIMIALSAPFFFGGLAVASCFVREPKGIFNLYCADLGGAGLGTLSQAVLFPIIPALFGATLLSGTSEFKGLKEALLHPGSRIEEEFTLLSGHYSVVDDPVDHGTPGISLSFNGALPANWLLFTDGFRAGAIPRVGSMGKSGLAFASALPGAVGFEFAKRWKRPRALLLGLRSGWNLLAAEYHGIDDVTLTFEDDSFSRAIEALRLRDPESAGHFRSLLGRARAERTSSSRFARSSKERFDLVYYSHTDAKTYANSSRYSLAPAFDLTRESVAAMIGLLSERGALVISGFRRNPDPQNERVLATLRAATSENYPSGQLVRISNPFAAAFLVKPAPFTRADFELIDRFSRVHAFDWALDRTSGGAVSPLTDERPFLERHFHWRQLGSFLRAARSGSYTEFLAEADIPFVFLLVTLGVSLLTSSALLAVPLAFVRKGGRIGAAAATLFLLYGAGYLMFELAWIERLGLFLGNLNLSFIVVLGAFLFFSGAGSFVARRFSDRTAFAGIILGAAAAWAGEHWLVAHAFGLSTPVRAALAASLIGPLAFFLGMPFPKTFREIASRGPREAALAYAFNAFASVNAATLSAVIVALFGFSGAFILAALAYCACAVLKAGA